MPTSIFYDANGLITRIVVTDSDADMAVHLPGKDETKVPLEKSQYNSFDHASLLKAVENITGKPPLKAPEGGEPQDVLPPAKEAAALKAFNDALAAGKTYEEAMMASGEAQKAFDAAASADVPADQSPVIAVP